MSSLVPLPGVSGPESDIVESTQLTRTGHCLSSCGLDIHSNRSAKIGSSREACNAGYRPKDMPTMPASPQASTTAVGLISTGQPAPHAISIAVIEPVATPRSPPVRANTLASVRNCLLMSRRRAPIAIRKPISRVLSFTDTNITFMMLMPPTSRDTEAMEIKRMPRACSVPARAVSTSAGFSMTKSSGALLREVVTLSQQSFKASLQLRERGCISGLDGDKIQCLTSAAPNRAEHTALGS